MAPLELEGSTLGEKHRNYNKLVKEAIISKTPIEPGDLNSGENDVENLMKIDIASNYRDVDYTLKVLKCEDMLYVSRAIKKSPWLITEQQYALIINPTYLTTQLFPEMTSNAVTKFLKHMRLHLKDEVRAEQFFNYEEDINIKSALNWLPNCSVTFIISKVQKYFNNIKIRLFKRLCERSPDIVKELLDEDARCSEKKLEVTNFLLHVNPELYLNVVEHQNKYNFPKFGIRSTKLLLQRCFDRIINKFEKYCTQIHLPTFVKHLKPENIRDFLITQSKNENENLQDFLGDFENVKCFLDGMIKEQRSQFVNEMFVNKIHNEGDDNKGSENYGMRKLYYNISNNSSEYVFHDFDTALDKITKRSNKDPMLLFELIVCAHKNQKNYEKIIQNYHDKNWKCQVEMKLFMELILPTLHISNLTPEAWAFLENLLSQMGVNTDLGDYVPGYIEAIVLYKVTHGEEVPDIIEKQIKVVDKSDRNIPCHRPCPPQVLKKLREQKVGHPYRLLHNIHILNDEEKEKVFNYMFNIIMDNIQKQNITDEADFEESVANLKWLMDILVEWNKELSDYPVILEHIKNYVKIKKIYSWETDLSSLYNKKKSWRRLMFEESIELCPSEMVCLNLLKHNNQFILNNEVKKVLLNERVSLQRFLNKLRVYWPLTLTAQWIQFHFDGLRQHEDVKTHVKRLCTLLPRQQLLQIINENAPKEAKINLNKPSDIQLDLQRGLAKNMHLARPRPPPEAILLYAKGDYLQHALPSLLAIYKNMNMVQTRQSITKLLEAPVSVRKHGIRISLVKLKAQELIPVLRDIWTNATNSTIRAVVFQSVYLLIDEDKTLTNDIWDTLFMFMGNLSHEENKIIYQIISREENYDKVPANRKAEYFMKSYTLLKELIPNLTNTEKYHFQWKLNKLVEHTKHFMECIPTDFIMPILSEFDEEFTKKEANDKFDLVAAFILCTKADKTQNVRYNMFLKPLLARCFELWDQTDEKRYVKVNVNKLFKSLRGGLKSYVQDQHMDSPIAMFEDIEKILGLLPLSDNYIMITKWKLTVELTRALKDLNMNNWDAQCLEAAPVFADNVLAMLKSDVTSHFPCIYTLFSTALKEVLEIIPDRVKLMVYQRFLKDSNFVQAYLAVIWLYPNNHKKELKNDMESIRNIIKAHPSMEIKMHYNHRFVNQRGI